jgi:hypothetical protein
MKNVLYDSFIIRKQSFPGKHPLLESWNFPKKSGLQKIVNPRGENSLLLSYKDGNMMIIDEGEESFSKRSARYHKKEHFDLSFLQGSVFFIGENNDLFLLNKKGMRRQLKRPTSEQIFIQLTKKGPCIIDISADDLASVYRLDEKGAIPSYSEFYAARARFIQSESGLFATFSLQDDYNNGQRSSVFFLSGKSGQQFIKHNLSNIMIKKNAYFVEGGNEGVIYLFDRPYIKKINIKEESTERFLRLSETPIAFDTQNDLLAILYKKRVEILSLGGKPSSSFAVTPTYHKINLVEDKILLLRDDGIDTYALYP